VVYSFADVPEAVLGMPCCPPSFVHLAIPQSPVNLAAVDSHDQCDALCRGAGRRLGMYWMGLDDRVHFEGAGGGHWEHGKRPVRRKGIRILPNYPSLFMVGDGTSGLLGMGGEMGIVFVPACCKTDEFHVHCPCRASFLHAWSAGVLELIR
jgi:hypothetical protein